MKTMCWRCRHVVFYKPGEFATQMGHIYSELGMKEYRISALCEWCFDEVTDQVMIEADNARS